MIRVSSAALFHGCPIPTPQSLIPSAQRPPWTFATLRRYLDDPAAAAVWLRSLGVTDLKRAARRRWSAWPRPGLPLDLLAVICDQLAQHLPRSRRPGHGAEQPRSLRGRGAESAVHGHALRARSDGPAHAGADLFHQPALQRPAGRRPGGFRPVAADRRGAGGAADAGRGPRRPRSRPWTTTRWCCGPCGGSSAARRCGSPTATSSASRACSTVTTQISYLADAILEAALRAAWRKLAPQRGTPRGPDGRPARFVVLGMGKLGGRELNYSSDIDLIFLYDVDGKTDGRRPITNSEFFDHLARELVRLLTEATELGAAYRVDLRLRPEGQRGPMVASTAAALNYYDMRGRTWERQAYIKALPGGRRPGLGQRVPRPAWPPWIYRRYLSRADISGIKALKRRIEQQTRDGGGDDRNVKTGHGGIRDVEFVIQFLQLLNGGDLPALRTTNTLEAIAQLEQRRLPDRPGAGAAGRELHLPPPHRAPAADHVRLADAPAAQGGRRAAEAGAADGLCRRAGAAGAGGLCRRLSRARPTSTARCSITCCTTPSATTPRPRPSRTWCSTPIRRRSGSSRCWASIPSAT